MQKVTVVLDEREYVIEEKRSRANRKWREQLEGAFAGLAGALEDAPETDVADGQALAGLVQRVSGTLLHSVETLTELVVAYAPELPLDNAYDSEVLDAFTAILGLAYPFGSMVARVRSGITSFNQQMSQS